MKKVKKKVEEILFVDILEPQPNPMFTEEQRAMVKFLRYNKAVECAYCQKKKRTLWTMLCAFKVGEMSSFVINFDKSFAPLTGVCTDHLMVPDWPQDESKKESDVSESLPTE
jgi:hypothetical protein